MHGAGARTRRIRYAPAWYAPAKMMETSPTKRGFRAGLTVGRGINATLALISFVLVILALVVVGNLAILHNRLIDHPDRFNTSYICILYSSEKGGLFQYGKSYTCEVEIWGFAIMAGVFVSYLVVSIARVVVAADIWCSAVVETVVMAVLVVFSFILGLIISTGLATTCNTVHNINKEENDCDRNVPNNSGIKYYHSVNSAQASVWLAFFLMGVMTMIYVIRSYIYFRRLRMQKASDHQPVLQDNMEESTSKPV